MVITHSRTIRKITPSRRLGNLYDTKASTFYRSLPSSPRLPFPPCPQCLSVRSVLCTSCSQCCDSRLSACFGFPVMQGTQFTYCAQTSYVPRISVASEITRLCLQLPRRMCVVTMLCNVSELTYDILETPNIPQLNHWSDEFLGIPMSLSNRYKAKCFL